MGLQHEKRRGLRVRTGPQHLKCRQRTLRRPLSWDIHEVGRKSEESNSMEARREILLRKVFATVIGWLRDFTSAQLVKASVGFGNSEVIKVWDRACSWSSAHKWQLVGIAQRVGSKEEIALIRLRLNKRRQYS